MSESKGVLGLYAMKGRRKKKKNKGSSSNNQSEQAAKLRMQKDIASLECPKNVELDFPDPNDLLNFAVKITVNSGLWKGGIYTFKFAIPSNYPHSAPKVTLDGYHKGQKLQIYHPNIDFEGNVCLNVLKADWRPILSLEQVIHGLRFLFLEPNPRDPLNQDAARIFRDQPEQFKMNVERSLAGGEIDMHRFPKSTNSGRGSR